MKTKGEINMADSSYIARRTRELAKSAGLSTSDVREMLARQIGAPGATPKLLSQGNQRKIVSLLKKGSSVFVGEIRTPAQRRDVIQKQNRRERKAWGDRNVEERENTSLLKALQNPLIAARLTTEDLKQPVNRAAEFQKEQKAFDDTLQMTWEQYQADRRFQTMNTEFDTAGIAAFFNGFIEDFADTVYPGWRGSGSPLEPYVGFELGAWY